MRALIESLDQISEAGPNTEILSQWDTKMGKFFKVDGVKGLMKRTSAAPYRGPNEMVRSAGMRGANSANAVRIRYVEDKGEQELIFIVQLLEDEEPDEANAAYNVHGQLDVLWYFPMMQDGKPTRPRTWPSGRLTGPHKEQLTKQLNYSFKGVHVSARGR